MSDRTGKSGAAAPDLVLEARWLLPMTAGQPVLADQAVAIQDGRIQTIAPIETLRGEAPDAARVSLANHALLPGLINAHGHAAMTLLRGFAEDLPLQRWLADRIWPTETAHVSERFVADGTRLAMAEMIRAGITTFADMYFFPDVVAREASRAGMRCVLSAPVVDFPNAWSRDADHALHRGLELRDTFRHDDLVQIQLGPHATYTLSRAGWERVLMFAEELDLGIQTHLHENAEEVQQGLAQLGSRPIAWLRELGALSPRLQAVHVTEITPAEMDWFAEAGVQVVHCPSSNHKLASGWCPVTELIRRGINLALGTDGAAANNRLDILGEAHLAALTAKLHSGDAGAVPASQALTMATRGGARALGLEGRIGTLAAGAFADLIAMDLRAPELQPLHQLPAALVHGAAGRSVSHSWVGGRPLLAEGELLTLDLEDLLSSAHRWQARIDS